MTTTVETREIAYWQSLNEALRLEMRRDPAVIVLGEDVAGAAGRIEHGLVDAWGGPFGVTRGLIQEFGPERIIDTPISEAAFIGAGVGAAIGGMRPWVDLMFTHFAGVAWDQITNKFARERYTTGGQASIPMVIKTFGPCYSPFIHFPGMKCVVPSNPYNAKGLMISAIRDDNPVVVFDNLRLLRMRAPVPTESYTVPIGKSEIVRAGTDITIVGVSWLTQECLNVAAELADEGISVEVIDLLSLEPLDEETILTSLAKTKHLVVVDQDHPRCSVARDIVALVMEKAFDNLDAPVMTVAPPETPQPLNRHLDEQYYPNAEKIAQAARQVLA